MQSDMHRPYLQLHPRVHHVGLRPFHALLRLHDRNSRHRIKRPSFSGIPEIGGIFQNGEILYTTQRPNELGYTYDILDVRLNNHTILAAKSNYVGILKSNQNRILFPKALWTQFKSYMMKHYSHIPSRLE